MDMRLSMLIFFGVMLSIMIGSLDAEGVPARVRRGGLKFGKRMNELMQPADALESDVSGAAAPGGEEDGQGSNLVKRFAPDFEELAELMDAEPRQERAKLTFGKRGLNPLMFGGKRGHRMTFGKREDEDADEAEMMMDDLYDDANVDKRRMTFGKRMEPGYKRRMTFGKRDGKRRMTFG